MAAGQADAEAAYLLDNDDYHTLYVVSAIRSLTGRPEEGIRHARRMIELNPLASGGYHMLGNCLDKAGGHAESITALTQAWRLGRHEPSRFDIANDLAHSHYMAENYDAAAQWGEQAVHLLPDYLQTRLVLAATYGQLGVSANARPHIDAILASRPRFSCVQHRARLAYVLEADRDHFIAGLLKAGLAE